MRTVHETEALRPSDPIPKNYGSNSVPSKTQRLKLTMKSSKQTNGGGNGSDIELDDDASQRVVNIVNEWPAELNFTESEVTREPKELYKLLRRQIHWAEQEQDELTKELEETEGRWKSEWEEKELLLLSVIESEKEWNERRYQIHERPAELRYTGDTLGILPNPKIQFKGDDPWFRQRQPTPPPRPVPVKHEMNGTGFSTIPASTDEDTLVNTNGAGAMITVAD
jgi:hypothetical protein